MFIQGVGGPVCGTDGRQDFYLYGSRAKNKLTLWRNVQRVVNHDGHHGHTCLHRQVKRTLLERGQARRHRARPFRCHHDTLALFAQRIDQRLHGLDCAGGVGTIYHHHAAELHHLANHGKLLDLLFAHSGNVATQQLCRYHHIGFTLMIENKHAGAAGPQVLLAFDFQVKSDQRSGGVSKKGKRKILRLAARSGQGPDRQARSKGRYHTAGGGD